MLSLYEILKASKTGIAPDMWTALAGMNWGGADSGHEVKELTGIPPLSFTADGTPLLDYLISGNAVQNGTPTPNNPVDVNGVGVRTENLWGDTTETNKYIGGQGNIVTPQNGDIFDQKGITVTPSSNFTFSWSNFVVGTDNNVPYIRICSYTTNGGTFINRTLVAPNVYPDKYATFTIPSNCTYVDIRIDNETSTRGQHFVNLMLNTGSTAKPFEPYGVKIPISSGGVTTNIYLGSTQTTRRIKKLVLDGTENWSEGPCTIGYRFNIPITSAMQSDTTIGVRSLCTHQILVRNGGTYNTLGAYTISAASDLLMTLNGDTRLASWKSWLATQYANGTPVTLYYVLATPKTATVNEPLMKIGNYADTVSMEQAGVQIPTLHGNTVIDVETELKPSQMYIKYQK